jgi:hypothetical protein
MTRDLLNFVCDRLRPIDHAREKRLSGIDFKAGERPCRDDSGLLSHLLSLKGIHPTLGVIVWR